jgi:CubicO group peptidase (beta-lactamase class C family)
MTDTTIQQRLEGFDQWIAERMAEWQVPGIAVGVIHKGELAFAKGYGFRDVDKGLPVTPETLFAIGSCSKAFTTFDMALLVEEGKLEWDKPVREYLPGFRMYDPAATDGMTPRDLVCHRSGLPRHDMVWYGSTDSRAELFSRLRYLKPSQPFRSLYQYNNLMFMTAGYLVGEIAGETWEDFTQKRIFDKLGMTDSNLSVEASKTAANASLPYELRDGKPTAVPYRNLDNVAPAGSINSSIADMSKWLKVHMYGDESLLPKAALHEMHKPVSIMPMTPAIVWSQYPEVAHIAYALGWGVWSYRGHSMVWHTGGIDGFISCTSYMPNDDFGVIVLTNLGENSWATVVAMNVYDRLLGLDQLPWSTRIGEFADKMRAQGEEAKQKALGERILNTTPSHPLADYTGKFQHPGYGTITVMQDGDGLKAKSNIDFALKHHHYDVFQLDAVGTGELFLLVAFEGDLDGSIARIRIGFEPSVEPIVFERVKS